MKIHFNERAQEIFTFSPQQRAFLAIALANRRLEEAEDLEERSKLDANMRTKLNSNFHYHLTKYENNVRALKLNNNIDEAYSAQSAFELSVSSHAHILGVLSTDNTQLGNNSLFDSTISKTGALISPATVSASTTVENSR